jgi:hypothetical protein
LRRQENILRFCVWMSRCLFTFLSTRGCVVMSHKSDRRHYIHLKFNFCVLG